MELETRRSLHALAAAQYGLVHRDQLKAFGFTRAQRYRLANGASWEWATSSVLRSRSSTPSLEHRLKLAQLDAGLEAILSHSTAMALWGVRGFVPEPVNLLLARFDKPRDEHVGRVHRTRELPARHAVEKDGWRVTSPARTLFDLAAVEHPRRVERALDSLWAQSLVSYEVLAATLDELAERGRTGITLMRHLIDARSDGYRPPDSGLESRLEQLLLDAGLPAPDRQVTICDEEGFIARVDFLYAQQRVVIFFDSDRYHTAKLDRSHDFAQTQRLHRAGYVVIRIVEHDLRFEPMKVVDAVRRALSAAS